MALLFSHHASVQPLPRVDLERRVVVVDGIIVILEEFTVAAILVEETITAVIADEQVIVTLEEESITAVIEELTIECE